MILFSKCLSERFDSVSAWTGTRRFLSVWSDQLMSIWTEPCVSFLSASVWGFQSVSALTGAKCFLSASVCLKGPMDVFLDWTQIFLSVLGLSARFKLCLLWLVPNFLLCRCLSRKGPMDVFLDWTQVFLSVLGPSARFKLCLLWLVPNGSFLQVSV